MRQHQDDVKHYWIGYYCVCPVTVPIGTIASRSETRTKSIEWHKKYIYIYLLDLQPGQLWRKHCGTTSWDFCTQPSISSSGLLLPALLNAGACQHQLSRIPLVPPAGQNGLNFDLSISYPESHLFHQGDRMVSNSTSETCTKQWLNWTSRLLTVNPTSRTSQNNNYSF